MNEKASGSRRSSDRLRILVLGYIVRRPYGGQAWHYIQYAMGLARLGHEVYFIEDSGDVADCFDPFRNLYGWDPSAGLEFLDRTLEEVGLPGHWAYYDAHECRWFGPHADNVLGLCQSADLLLNISGLNPIRSWFMQVPNRVFIDTDPLFTQVRHLSGPGPSGWESLWVNTLVSQHTAFFSFGENIGRPICQVPNNGLQWQATRQPVVLDAWPVTKGPAGGRFTTVMTWQPYKPAIFRGVNYGLKSDSFTAYMDLPGKTGSTLELTVRGKGAPVDLLVSHGWILREPNQEASDPWIYQRYIQQSKAEFSVAKHGYVISRSGWFSERSASYLASGRPVVVQDTGFSEWLPTGAGVLSFSSPEEAIAGIGEVTSRYEFHCRAARALAEEYFDSKVVLSQLVEKAMRSANTGVDRV